MVVNHGELSLASGCESCCAMLNQWLWITVLFWASGRESWCIIQSQWLLIMSCYSEPMVLIHGQLCGCESWCVILGQWLRIMVCCSEPLVVNHYVLCEAQWLWIVMYYAEQSGYESWCAMLSPVVGNHGVLCRTSCCESWFVILSQLLCWASGCKSWFIMLNQWFWIMVYHAEPVVVSHGVFYWASSC